MTDDDRLTAPADGVTVGVPQPMPPPWERTIRPLITAEQIAKRVAELGAEITRDYGDKELTVVAVLKGSFLFVADLCRAIGSRKARFDFLRLLSYGDEKRSSGEVQIIADLTHPVEGRHVLVVEDIIDTGLTMSFLLEMLAARRPASVKVCSLLDKPARRKVPVRIDYIGFTIEDLFVAGYGLDLEQYCRNLSFVGVAEKEKEKEKE